MKRKKIKQIVLPLSAAIIWGSSFVAQSLGADYVEGFTFASARCFAAALAILLMLAVRQIVRPRPKKTAQQRRELLKGGAACGLALTVASNLQQFGIADTTAGKAGFITALYIVLVPLFGIFFGKRVRGRMLLCVAIAVGGLYFLCFESGAPLHFGRGDFFVFLGSFGFAGHILVIDHFARDVDGIELSCVQFAVTALLSGICAVLFGTVDFAAIWECMPYILYVGVISGGVGYTLQILAQQDGEATVVSLLLSLESFFAVVSAAIILHERMSAREYLGCALMLTAVILSQLPERKAVACAADKEK